MCSWSGSAGRRVLLVVAILAATAGVTEAQSASQPRTFEALGVLGFTNVDLDAWGGSGNMNEELFASGIVGRYLHPSTKSYQFGVELGWIYYLYYEVDYPPFILYRDVSATHLGPIVRFPLNDKISVDLGVNLHTFDGFTDIGITGGLSYKIPIGPTASLPVGLRTTIILDSDAMLMMIGGTVGLSLKR